MTVQEDLHWIHLELGRASASESGGRGPAAEGDPRFKSAEVLAELEQCVTASRQRQDPPAPSPKVPHNFTITIIIIEKKKKVLNIWLNICSSRDHVHVIFHAAPFFPTLEDRNRNRRSALGLFSSSFISFVGHFLWFGQDPEQPEDLYGYSSSAHGVIFKTSSSESTDKEDEIR